MPKESPYTLPPAGSHVAVCTTVADLGTQPSKYGDKPQIIFGWELQDERMNDGRPFTVNRRYTLSSNKNSALRGDLESWLGHTLTGDELGRLDLATLLGMTCMISIKHETREDGRTFANVVSVMQRPKGVLERLPPINPAVAFSLAENPFPQQEFDDLPQWMQDTIRRSPEYGLAMKPQSEVAVSADTQRRLRKVMADSPAPKAESKSSDDDLNDSIPF